VVVVVCVSVVESTALFAVAVAGTLIVVCV